MSGTVIPFRQRRQSTTHVSTIRSAPLARAKLVTAVVAALPAVSIALGLSAPSPSPPRVANDFAQKILDASVAVSQIATMRIVPSPVIDPGADVFIGTGDGSNGSWVHP